MVYTAQYIEMAMNYAILNFTRTIDKALHFSLTVGPSTPVGLVVEVV